MRRFFNCGGRKHDASKVEFEKCRVDVAIARHQKDLTRTAGGVGIRKRNSSVGPGTWLRRRLFFAQTKFDGATSLVGGFRICSTHSVW